MQQNPMLIRQKQKNKSFFILFLSLLIILTSDYSFAQTIVITGPIVISTNTAYTNVTLDMTNGSFIIKNNAQLDIENSVINGVLSLKSPFLFQLVKGQLKLNNNKINVTAGNVPPSPGTTSVIEAIQVIQGTIIITANTASVDLPFRVGFLVTGSLPTSNFMISDNIIRNFHGGIFLSNSDNASIINNEFNRVSVTNILTTQSNNSLFKIIKLYLQAIMMSAMGLI